MTYRAGFVAALGLVLVVSLVPVAGQGDRLYSGAATDLTGLLEPGESGAVPTTPWGDPDLRGVWNNSTDTPLEHMTEAEKERGRLAQQAVIEATGGTGAAWIERSGTILRDSLVVDPPDGRIPELLPAAQQRLIERENARAGRGEADSWLDRNSWERCISRTMPVAMIPNGYGVRQGLGDSRGRWEGNTLVVETERFNNRLDGGNYQPSHIIQTGHRGPGGTMRLVERFTMTDANQIDYRITVEDPNTFTRP